MAQPVIQPISYCVADTATFVGNIVGCAEDESASRAWSGAACKGALSIIQLVLSIIWHQRPSSESLSAATQQNSRLPPNVHEAWCSGRDQCRGCNRLCSVSRAGHRMSQDANSQVKLLWATRPAQQLSGWFPHASPRRHCSTLLQEPDPNWSSLTTAITWTEASLSGIVWKAQHSQALECASEQELSSLAFQVQVQVHLGVEGSRVIWADPH